MKKYFSKTNKKTMPFLAILLCALMVLTVFPSNISYAADDDVYSYNLITYNYNENCHGYYFTPKAPGKYDTLVMIHGGGGVGSTHKDLISVMNTWVKAGHFEPMVVVVPVVGDYNGSGLYIEDFLEYIDNDDKFGTLLENIESGALSTQIDTEGDILVSGFSMGGMAAFLAGAVHNTRIKKVGTLSGSANVYLQEDTSGGYYTKKNEIYFSKDPDAIVFMAAGQAEANPNTFIGTIDRYKDAIESTGNNKEGLVTVYKAPDSWGGHNWRNLAVKELFMFLYLNKYGELPTQEFVETACSGISYQEPNILNEDTEHPTPEVTIKPYDGEDLVDLDMSTYVKDTTTDPEGEISIGGLTNSGTLDSSTVIKMSSQSEGPASLDLSKQEFTSALGSTTSYLKRTIDNQMCNTNNTFNTVENVALEEGANTISFWAKYVPENNGSFAYNLFDYNVTYDDETGSMHLFTLDQKATTESAFVLAGRSNSPVVTGRASVTEYADITDEAAGKWAHYVITNPAYSSNDRKVMKIYVNGEYVYSRMVVKPSGTVTNAKIAFGGDASPAESVYWPTDFSLGDVKIYDGELTATEVMSEYTIEKDKYIESASELPLIEGYTFSDSTVTYDEQNHTMAVSVADDATPDTTITYTCNGEEFTGATEMGTYNVTATITKDGYTDLILNARLKIKGGEITGYTFSDSTLEYDGENHMINVSAAADATEGTTVTYTCDGEAFTGATEIGTYVVTATISKANYNDLVLTATLEIEAVSLDFDVEFDTESRTFNVNTNDALSGVNRVLLVVKDSKDNVVYMDALNAVTADSASFNVDLGENLKDYEYSFTLSSMGDTIDYSTKTCESDIDPDDAVALLNIEGYTFTDSTVDYDGETHTIAVLAAEDATEEVNVTYTCDGEEFTGATEAGTYNVTATLSKEGYNDLALTAKLTINPAEITGYTFTDDAVNYDGGNHTIAVLAAEDATADTTVTYTCNGEEFTGATEIGVYEVTATISKVNYNDLVLTATLEIIGADITGYTFTDSTVDYDGENHTITVLAADDATDEVTITYTCNGEEFTGATQVGTYDVTVTISKTGYNDLVLTARLKINAVHNPDDDVIFDEATFFDVTYDEATRSFIVEGEILNEGSSSANRLLLMVYDPESNGNADPYYMDVLNDHKGAFEFRVPLDDAAVGGEYTFVVTSYGDVVTNGAKTYNYTSDFETYGSIAPGSAIGGTYTLGTDEDAPIVLIAIYKDGILVRIATANDVSDGKITAEIQFAADEDTTNYTAKAFVWKNATTLRPLMKARVLK